MNLREENLKEGKRGNETMHFNKTENRRDEREKSRDSKGR